MESAPTSSPIKKKKTRLSKRKRRVPNPEVECFSFPYFAHQQLDPEIFPTCKSGSNMQAGGPQ